MTSLKSLLAALASVTLLGACAQHVDSDRRVQANADPYCCGAQQLQWIVSAPPPAVGTERHIPQRPTAAPPRVVASPPAAAPSTCSVDGCGRIVAAHVVAPQYGQVVPLSTCVAGVCGVGRQNVATLELRSQPSSVTMYWVPKEGYDPAGCAAKGGVTTVSPQGRPTCSITRLVVPGEAPMPQNVVVKD